MDYQLACEVAKNNWRDRRWWRSTAVPFARRTAIKNIHKPYYAITDDGGSNFAEEDWDNLVILDACRYDMFEHFSTIDGRLTKKTSLASSTPEFLQKTFGDETYHDIVYVTANPQVSLRLSDDTFFDVVSVWESDWDSKLATVHPEAVTEAAIDAYHSYPEKRLIVHFMQPHYPFIGETGKNALGSHSGFELSRRLAAGERPERDHVSVWDRLEAGDIDIDVVWKAYIENLSLVLSEAERLVERFEERTVITSDHGNLLGEAVPPFGIQMYGHPSGIRAPELVTVPWLTIDGTRRKTITAGQPTTKRTHDEEEIRDRLSDLGYF